MKHLKTVSVSKADALSDFLNEITRSLNDFTYEKKNATG